MTRKTRIPSIPYLEQKIAEIGAIAAPAQNEIMLLAHYKKLMAQRATVATAPQTHKISSKRCRHEGQVPALQDAVNLRAASGKWD